MCGSSENFFQDPLRKRGLLHVLPLVKGSLKVNVHGQGLNMSMTTGVVKTTEEGIMTTNEIATTIIKDVIQDTGVCKIFLGK